MAVILALLSAASFGVGDFFGGLATRRSGGAALPVVVIGHLAGLGVIVALLPFFAAEWDTDVVVRGALAGLAGGVGLAFLYRGLALGRMALVAPLTAVGSAAIPVVYGVATGERPELIAWVGVGLGLLALPLLAATGHGRIPGAGRIPPGLTEGIVAGLGFALFFIILDSTAGGSGVIPLVAARLASIPFFGGLALASRQRLRLPRPIAVLAVAAGVLDMVANAFFLGATREGLLTLVTVIVALYPGLTVALARAVLRERIEQAQGLGMILAGLGIVLIALG